MDSIFKQQPQFQFAARRDVSPAPESVTLTPGQSANSTIDSDYSQQQHLRYFRESSSASQSFGKAGASTVAPNLIELTRNDKYSVSKLNATPSILSSSKYSSDELEAYLSHSSKHACIASKDSLNVWNYVSADSVPITYTLNISNSDFSSSKNNKSQAGNIIPVLVLPSPGIEEPGLVAIDVSTGDTRYYEYIINDASVNLWPQNKNLSYRIPLLYGEKITLYENIEPVGIVVATSEGRVFLLSLRDSAGKPHLKCSTIISSSFLPFFRSTTKIVSIKGGKNLGHGARSLSILTDRAVFMLWSVARDGQAIKLYEASLKDHFLTEIKDLYNADHIDILDCQPLFQENQQDAFLILTSLKISRTESCYILFTVKKDGDEMLVFSAYRLIRYTFPYKKTTPKLYLPSPSITAFIAFEDAIVLVDVITKLNHSYVEKRKWEDIVSFRSGVDIIGTSFEDLVVENDTITNLPSIIAVTKEAGILKIERCLTKGDFKATQVEELSTATLAASSGSSFTKSHIEQAVFYGYSEDNPLSFNVPENVQIESSEIEDAIVDVGNDLVNSASVYLPPRLSSVESHLQLRLLKLKNLVLYIASNFLNEISVDTKVAVITDVEKLNAAVKIWSVFEQAFKDNNHELIALFGASINEVVYSSGSHNAKDSIEDFFYFHVAKIGDLLANIIKKLLQSSNVNNYAVAVLLALKSIKEGAIDANTEIRQEIFHLSKSEIGSNLSWIVENDLCFIYNDLFYNYYDSIKDLTANQNSQLNTDEISSFLVSLVSILFFSFSYGLSYYTSKSLTKTTREEIQRYKSVYESNRGTWIKSLVKFGEMHAALTLAETFEDLLSLVEICNGESERLLANGESDEPVQEVIEKYFDKFGYRFAEALYNYYVFTGKLQDLILGFPEHNTYLKRFLKSGDHGRISWIRHLLSEEYFEGSSTLYNVASKSDDLVSNKKLQLSIAKLSLLAAPENPNSEDLLLDIENGLTVLEIQEYLATEVSKFRASNSNNDLVSEVDNILSQLTTNLQKRSPNILFANLRKPLTKLLSNKTVELNELIDLYTLLDIKTKEMNLDFYQALKLASTGLLGYAEKKVSEILIWRRAILSNDWKEIGTLKNKSPEYVLSKTESSVLYITLLHCFEDNLFSSSEQESNRIKLPDLDYLIQPIYVEDLAKRFKNLNQKTLVNLSEELNKEVGLIKDIMNTFDFKVFVKGIIGTAQKNSGSTDVVNYQTLELA